MLANLCFAAVKIVSDLLYAVGCLVFSTTRIGNGSVVGTLATLHAGARLPNGHTLRPYGTMSQPNALIKGDAIKKYPHFYAEQHLTAAAGDLAAAVALLLQYICILPALSASLLFLSGAVHASTSMALPDAVLGASSWAALMALVVLGVISHHLVVLPMATWLTNTTVLLFKRLVRAVIKTFLDCLDAETKPCNFLRETGFFSNSRRSWPFAFHADYGPSGTRSRSHGK